jgi:hypothetical protein
MAGQSATLVEALDGIRDVLEHQVPETIENPRLTIGPAEHILAFSTNEHHELKDSDTQFPYFSNTGVITDLHGRVLPGATIQTSLKIDKAKFGALLRWPPEQPSPFNLPPSKFEDTEPLGFSKQAYFFPDGSSLVTVGPSVPKLLPLQGGGAQLWVASVGVITQGTEKYAGVRGISAYTGSAHFPNWPQPPQQPWPLLAAGFSVRSAAFFKLVLHGDQS